ncbi:MAG: hypothetical protein QOI21_5738 [Actinomycetota bacterium]|nr:hypothetical protein [Actinomycetota bacterium]
MRPRKPVLAAIALGLGLVCGLFLTGCGQQAKLQPGAEQPGTVNDPAAHWAEDYCGAVVQLVQTLATMPSVDPSTPQQASRTSSDLLGSVIDGLDRTLSGLAALGPSPASGGDAVRADATRTFSGIRSRAATAKERIDAVSVDDTEATRQALVGASAPLDEISKLNLLSGIDSVPELAAASKRALSCEPLTAKGFTR